MRPPIALIAVALVLILGGGALASFIQTDRGRVSISDIRWETPTGTRMSALLYVPDGVTESNPAPGILAIHGYINSRETQSGFAIEFARRGYVVLALDQTGHGYSDPPAFTEGFGGPAGLQYLRSLPFVDTANVGMEGHSMGGWASDAAAIAYPEDYRAIVLAGSSTGAFGGRPGTPTDPRNLGLIWSRWDEFSQTMWGTPTAAEARFSSDRMKAVFGAEDEIEVGRLYGSIEDGTGRMLFEPRTNHPGDHLSPAAIGNAIEWFGMTIEGGRDIPPSEQTWYWKELGTTLGIIGMILLLIPIGRLMLETRFFAPLASPEATSVNDLQTAGLPAGWWVAALFTALLGPLTLFPFKDLPGIVGWAPGPIFPQSITNSVIAWTTVLGIISLVLFALWHLIAHRRPNYRAGYGLTSTTGSTATVIAKSFLLALIVGAAAYLSLVITDLLFTTDFRFWVFAIKPMSAGQLRMAITYAIPFAFYFLSLNLTLRAQLGRPGWSLRRSMLVNIAILTSGWILLYLYQYIPLLSGRRLPIDDALWTVISYQLLPLMTIAGVLLTYFNRRTSTIYTGVFLTSMLVSWIVVASQATHFAR